MQAGLARVRKWVVVSQLVQVDREEQVRQVSGQVRHCWMPESKKPAWQRQVLLVLVRLAV